METAQPSDSVGGLLNESRERGSSVAMLDYVRDIREFNQSETLETMVSNEHLSSIADVLKGIKNSIEIGFVGMAKSMMLSQRAVQAIGQSPYDGNQMLLEPSQREIRDVTPREPASISGESESDTHVKAIMVTTQKISDYLGESTFYLRNAVRILALGAVKPHENERPHERPREKPKLDSGGGFTDGIFGWLLDMLGFSGEFAAVSGFFKTIKSRLTGTFKNIGTAMDKVLGFFGKSISRIVGFVGEWGGKIFKPIAGFVTGLMGKIGTSLNKLSGGRFGVVLGAMQKALGKLSEKLIKPLVNVGEKVLGPIGKLGGKLFTKVSGISMAKAIPVLGWILTAVMAVNDAGNALKDSVKITGKAKELQTLGDKLNVGISGIISGFTFGLVDTKTVYKWVTFAEDAIGGALKSLFNLFPKGFQDAMKGVFNVLFDGKTGIFGFLYPMVEGMMDKLANGQYMSLALDALLFIPKGLIKLLGGITSKVATLFESGKAGAELRTTIWTMMKDMLIAMKDWAVGAVKKLTSDPLGTMKSIGSSLWTKLTDENSSVREARLADVQGQTDKINELMNTGDKKGAADALKKLQAYVSKNSIAGDMEFKSQAESNLQLAQMAVNGGNPTSNIVAAPQSLDTNQTMNSSRQRMDSQNKAPIVSVAPPVINMPQPAPAQTKISRRREGSMDQGIAFANYVGN